MNKRFSTLVAAFAAIATVSYAQIGDKYVHLKTSSDLPDGYEGESGKSRLCETWYLLATKLKLQIDSALWKAEVWFVSICRVMTPYLHSLTNKATQKTACLSAAED